MVKDKIAIRLYEMAFDGIYFNKSVLLQHGLYTPDVIKMLYYLENLDHVTFREACTVTDSLQNTRRRRWRIYNNNRNKCKIKGAVNRFTPHEILGNKGEYLLLLEKRDKYIEVSTAMKLLNINKYTLCRLLQKLGPLRGDAGQITTEGFCEMKKAISERRRKERERKLKKTIEQVSSNLITNIGHGDLTATCISKY